jgi:predicted cupin superfamily sugar epimerase
VAPGFEFADNEFADRARLLKEAPQAAALIERFAAPKPLL